MTARAPGVLTNVVSTYRTGGIAISPGATHCHVPTCVRLSDAPGFGVAVDSRARRVGDVHVVEGKRTSRSCRWPVIGQAAGTAYITVVCASSFVAPFDRSVDKRQ